MGDADVRTNEESENEEFMRRMIETKIRVS